MEENTLSVLKIAPGQHPQTRRVWDKNCFYFARLLRMGSHCSTVEESIRL